MITFAHARRTSSARGPLPRVLAVLALLFLASWAFSVIAPTPAQAAPSTPLATGLYDDFTHDTELNTNLWSINGPVASNFSSDNCPACSVIPLTPSFSSAGMEIADANANSVIGAIQSVENFTPPLTVTAFVKGIVSDGHPFVFGITTQDASAGVQVTGNLNPDDCSAENNCGNPSTCGTPPAGSSIAPDQCFYGIYARAGSNGGNWKKAPPMDLTPAVGVLYTLTIAVDSSGVAQFNVSAGGQLLGQSTDSVGTGPFYIIMGQSEGVPVPGPGNNSAVWTSVTLTPSTNFSPPSSSSPSGISSMAWLLIIVVVLVVLLLALVAYNRRGRHLTVTVLDSGTLSPIPGAGVSADGPKSFSGSTGEDGRVAFGGVKAGDYSVKAGAGGYAAAPPVTVPVKRTTAHTFRLNSIAPSTPGAVAPPAPTAVIPRPVPEVSRELPAPTVLRAPAPTVAPPPPPSPPPPAAPPALEEEEGFGGERIRQVIQTFRAKGAVSPQTALTADQLGLSRIFVRIMKRRRGKTKVFVEVNGKYYLDEQALERMK